MKYRKTRRKCQQENMSQRNTAFKNTVSSYRKLDDIFVFWNNNGGTFYTPPSTMLIETPPLISETRLLLLETRLNVA